MLIKCVFVKVFIVFILDKLSLPMVLFKSELADGTKSIVLEVFCARSSFLIGNYRVTSANPMGASIWGARVR
jgi:hypothetical protein